MPSKADRPPPVDVANPSAKGARPDPKQIAQSAVPYAFRPARPNDAQAVSSLVYRVWAHHFAYSVSEDDLAHFRSTVLDPATIAREIESDKMRFILAVVPKSPDEVRPAPVDEGDDEGDNQIDTIVGMAQLVLGKSDPSLTGANAINLQRLYIETSHHGSGLAPALMRQSEKAARDEGAQSIWLGVWDGNARAARFYEKMGFVRRGEVRFMVGSSERRDWVMEKGL